MGWDISADVVDFDEAIDHFREKLPYTDEEYAQLDESAQEQAFRVAGVAQLDIVADVYNAIDEAIATGTALDDFKKIVGDELEHAWGGTVEDPGWRIETIFRTNIQSAYAAGRYAQMTDPETLADRPFWTFSTIEDGRECDICEPCDEVVLPADDPWWHTHHVPLHFNCRCEAHSLTTDEAKKRGVDAVGPPVEADEGFGAPPKLASWEPHKDEYPSELWKELEAKGKPAAPPEPPPVFIQNITKGRGVKDVPDVLRLIDHPSVARALQAVPLSDLTFKKRVSYRGKHPNGLYSPFHRGIEVTTERTPGTWGEPFKPGSSWSVSYSGATREEAVERTFVHELGHHLHLTAGMDVVGVERAVHDGFLQRKPITEYAGQDHAEYFAESFAAYRYHPNELRTHDPAGFAMVERVLDLLNDHYDPPRSL